MPRLTPKGLEVLNDALAKWWATLEFVHKPTKDKPKTVNSPKLTLNQKREKLDVSINTLKLILKCAGVDRSTLEHAFEMMNIEFKEEYCTELPQGHGNIPRPPALLEGRTRAVNDLKKRMFVARANTGSKRIICAMRGWPGVGKTSVATKLANESALWTAFPDGVLWTSLGTEPDVLSQLIAWGEQVSGDMTGVSRVDEASQRLTAVLRTRRMLLIVDDIWEQEAGLPFLVGGRRCATLLTMRETKIAEALAPTIDDVYLLPGLEEKDALKVLRAKAPDAVAGHPEACLRLSEALEGLPLALVVAGSLLQAKKGFGSNVEALLDELRDGAAILAAKAPADRSDVANQTTPLVATLFQKSTERLDDDTLACFALLGAFPSKPAKFGLEFLQKVWRRPDGSRPNAEPILETLVGRGLVEPVGEGLFWIHALLVSHARSLLSE